MVSPSTTSWPRSISPTDQADGRYAIRSCVMQSEHHTPMQRLTSLIFTAAVIAALLVRISSAQPALHPPRPGTINYIEGEAAINGQPLTASAIGAVDLDCGQTLATRMGRAEVLLTPGVFLRIDHDSAVTMISPDFADTAVRVDRGRALVEVADIHKQNHIQIDEDSARAVLIDTGLYDFDANRGQVRVFEGKALASTTGKSIKVTKEQALTVTGDTLALQKIDTRPYEDDFFRWSALRSGYLSEATADQARVYIDGGSGWVGTGWYWDPVFDDYTFIPTDGIVYSPFGWGFYSPAMVYRSPYYYGFREPSDRHHFEDVHPPYGHGVIPPGAFRGGGFRRGPVGGTAVPRTGATPDGHRR